MKVVDAYWEKRNLDVSCFEIIVEDEDKMLDLGNVLENIGNAEYVIFKIPSNKVDIVRHIQEYNFKFVETSLNVSCDVNKIKLNSYYERFNKEITYSPSTKEDIKFIYEEINKGIFNTDRVSIDPKFTEEQSANRYMNWINDELNRGTEIFTIKYKNNKIGFFTFKQVRENVYYPFLAGLFTEYRTSSLGFSIIYKPIEEVRVRGGKSIQTVVSSNNTPIVKLHTMIGFNIDKINYILVKHNNLGGNKNDKHRNL